MPELIIRIKKRTDGGAALSCERADGTSTWQRQDGAQGRFFPWHDLTHYAVETVLGHRRGFYGLVSEGWNVTDFGAPWPRGPMPDDMDPSELIVGFLDVERAAGVEWTATDFNARARDYFVSRGVDRTLALTDEQLSAVRALRATLFARWSALPAGQTLELRFEVPPAPAPATP